MRETLFMLWIVGLLLSGGCSRAPDPVFKALGIFPYELAKLGKGEFEVVEKNGENVRILYTVDNQKQDCVLYLQPLPKGRLVVTLYTPRGDGYNTARTDIEDPLYTTLYDTDGSLSGGTQNFLNRQSLNILRCTPQGTRQERYIAIRRKE